jgi:hypothetical protein
MIDEPSYKLDMAVLSGDVNRIVAVLGVNAVGMGRRSDDSLHLF